ncbi:hypothetical protein [Paraburkholderia caffeinilytica]|uniref:hypothetical protein n=1 Tax=Paraburkholderia caffeinilytica TaxID=1761016 RepID=UPI0013BE9F9B|nr:hypothetical protein [Paraburkholderia caffeinilytica]CAB3798081.1 hypothetical protein LMG28690_04659 [Paraburkholderia caffeinilytica]
MVSMQLAMPGAGINHETTASLPRACGVRQAASFSPSSGAPVDAKHFGEDTDNTWASAFHFLEHLPGFHTENSSKPDLSY